MTLILTNFLPYLTPAFTLTYHPYMRRVVGILYFVFLYLHLHPHTLEPLCYKLIQSPSPLLSSPQPPYEKQVVGIPSNGHSSPLISLHSSPHRVYPTLPLVLIIIMIVFLLQPLPCHIYRISAISPLSSAPSKYVQRYHFFLGFESEDQPFLQCGFFGPVPHIRLL